MVSAATVATDDRIVLVEAPTGYGKTAFAESALASRAGLVVRVRPTIAEPGLAGALQRAMRRAGLATEPADTLEDVLDAVLATLATAASRVHLFVDDAHLLAPL